MMAVVVQRLHEGSRARLADHFLALPLEDRRWRFGSALPPATVSAYVNAIDFDRDTVFAVHDDRLAVVGVAHVAIGDDLAELGLSVSPGRRRQGVGTALFERASEHARNRFISRLYMHCLKDNAPIMHIARKFHMDIVTSLGDADAHLKLPVASPASIAMEFVTDRLALYDYALRTQTAALRCNAGFGVPASAPAPPRWTCAPLQSSN
jgi:GNAT superfamily N-acetyltransferase